MVTTYNRNCYGKATFIDCGKWCDYYPTGQPRPTPYAQRQKWSIVATIPAPKLVFDLWAEDNVLEAAEMAEEETA